MNRLARPEERGEWLAAPQLVKRVLRAAQNEIVLPAAILQPPYFNAAADDAVNYGAIGAVIGHEIGHGLDHEGRWFTATGALRDWWQAQDVTAYAARVQPVLDQLSLAAERRSNPQATVIVSTAYRCSPRAWAMWRAWRWRIVLPDVARGTARAGHRRTHGRSAILPGLGAHLARERSPEFRRQFSLTSRYAPPDFRANATAGHLDAFYEAFGVSASDALFVPPARRARLY
jgi:predicted metalloendopeptidase